MTHGHYATRRAEREAEHQRVIAESLVVADTRADRKRAHELIEMGWTVSTLTVSRWKSLIPFGYDRGLPGTMLLITPPRNYRAETDA